MKTLNTTLTYAIGILVAVEILIALHLTYGPPHHDQDYARAVVDWVEDPTPATEAVLKRERARFRRVHRLFRLGEFGVLGLNMAVILGLFRVRRRVCRKTRSVLCPLISDV